MTSESEQLSSILKLCHLAELDEAASIVAEMLQEKFNFHSTGILFWDQDLEDFTDSFARGEQISAIEAVINQFQSELKPEEDTLIELPRDRVESGIGTVYVKSLRNSAALFLAGATDCDQKALEDFFSVYPIALYLTNSWTYTELLRENRRLRNSYDELEDKTTELEEQTRRLINDMTMRDSLRTKQVERERLVYWISHSVRSSVRIQEVLETTVEKVGTTLSLSRCHLLRAGINDSIEIYHYSDGNVPSINDKFLEGDGLTFTRTALRQKSPRHLDDPSVEENGEFSNDFLIKLGVKSGLIQPIVMRDLVLGVLFLEDCTVSREWSIDDMSMIDSLADHLAVAIENAELHRELEKQAVTDGLTGVANRRSFNEALEREFERAKRYSQDLSLIVVDLDFLKKINDTYGHMTGDEAIKSIGHVLAQSSRSTDITARYGGEEFCVLLPNTDIGMAEQLGERLRRLIADTHVEGPGNLSASLGVASYPLHAGSPDMLFLRADEALYQAKQDGRNCIRVAIEKDSGSEPNSTGDSKQSLVQEKT